MKETKEKWLKVIKENCVEVTTYSNYKFAGIYMLYVDYFEDKDIIPVYIGQTKNFQRRYKDHFIELLELNHKNYDDYCDYIRSKEAEKKYKYCKIFKYLVDRGLTLDNLHMIIIEKCEQSLNELELHYINYFKSDIFGFNSLNSISNYFESNIYEFYNIISSVTFLNDLKLDIEKTIKYQNYGYTQFNIWNLYRRYNCVSEVKEKLWPIVEQNICIYDDDGIKMLDIKYNLEEYKTYLDRKLSELTNEKSNIENKIKSVLDNLLKNKNYKSQYKEQFIKKALYYLGIDINDIYSDPSDSDIIYKSAKKFVDENHLKDKYKQLLDDYNIFNKKYYEFFKIRFYYYHPDIIIYINRIPHPSKTIFKYICPLKKFEKYVISRKFNLPLDLIEFPKNSEDVNIIFVISKIGQYISNIDVSGPQVIYVGIKYNNSQINSYFPLFPEQDDTALMEYYTSFNKERLMNKEKENKQFEIEFPKILNTAKGNFNIKVFGSGNNKYEDIIKEFFKDNDFYDTKRIKIK